MVKMTAKKAFTYANKALKPGDPFDARDADARVLKAIGRADAAAPARAMPAQVRAPMVAKALDAQPKTQAKQAAAHTYKRRDLVAE